MIFVNLDFDIEERNFLSNFWLYLNNKKSYFSLVSFPRKLRKAKESNKRNVS